MVKTKGGNRRGKVRKINEWGKKKEDTKRNEGCLRPRMLFACCPFVERESAGRKEGEKRGIIPFVSCGDKGRPLSAIVKFTCRLSRKPCFHWNYTSWIWFLLISWLSRIFLKKKKKIQKLVKLTRWNDLCIEKNIRIRVDHIITIPYFLS